MATKKYNLANESGVKVTNHRLNRFANKVISSSVLWTPEVERQIDHRINAAHQDNRRRELGKDVIDGMVDAIMPGEYSIMPTVHTFGPDDVTDEDLACEMEAIEAGMI